MEETGKDIFRHIEPLIFKKENKHCKTVKINVLVDQLIMTANCDENE